MHKWTWTEQLREIRQIHEQIDRELLQVRVRDQVPT